MTQEDFLALERLLGKLGTYTGHSVFIITGQLQDGYTIGAYNAGLGYDKKMESGILKAQATSYSMADTTKKLMSELDNLKS